MEKASDIFRVRQKFARAFDSICMFYKLKMNLDETENAGLI